MSDDQDGCDCFFWYQPTRLVPDKRPLNGCVCMCVWLLAWLTDWLTDWLGWLSCLPAGGHVDASATPRSGQFRRWNVVSTTWRPRCHPAHQVAWRARGRRRTTAHWPPRHAAIVTQKLAGHVSFMQHLKKYADRINTKYAAEICGNHWVVFLWSELSRRKLSLTLTSTYYSCPTTLLG